MQFCTIDEAWGRKNYSIDNNINEIGEISGFNEKIPSLNSINKTNNEQIDEMTNNDSLFNTLTETTLDRKDCRKLIDRVLKSRKCRNALRRRFSPKILEKLDILLDDYRDLVVLVLLGFSIVLFFNLVRNLNK